MDRPDQHASERSGLWRAYRIVWSLVAGGLLGTGLVAAALTLSPGAMLGLMIAVGVPVGTSVSAWSLITLLPRWAGFWAAVWAGIVMNAASGLVTLAGLWTLAALVAVGATMPDLVAMARARLDERRRPARPTSPRSSPGIGGLAVRGLVAHDVQFDDPHACRLLDPARTQSRTPEPTTLSTADLGRLWKVSGKWLELGLRGTEMAHLVQLRSACLDELEDRDPTGFRQWVRGGRPWASEPTGYIDGTGEPLPPPEGP